MMALVVFFAALMGFASLAVSMRRHQSIAPSLVRYRALFRNGGFGLLLASLALSLAQPRAPIAVVEWFFLLTAAGMPVVAAVTVAQFKQPKSKNAR